MSNELRNIIETCVISPILVALATVIVAYINSLSARLKEKVNSEQISKCIDVADDIVRMAVTSVNQTYVDALKKDGVFDKEAQKEALEKSKQLISEMLTDEFKKTICENYVNFDSWLTTKIEQVVNEKGSNSQGY